MTRIEVADLIRIIEEVPPLSPTHQRIMRLLAREDTTVEQIAEALHEDPRLPNRILAAANATENRGRGSITSLARGIVTIGFAGVKSLLVSSTAIASLRSFAGPGVTELWQRGFAAGLAARQLAVRLHGIDPEEAFLLGFLQHVGQVLLRVRYAKPYGEVLQRLREPGCDIVAIEREVFGLSHQDVGYLLARRWGLPEAVVQVIYRHHDPETAGVFQPEAVLAHVSDLLACALGCGSDGDPHVRPLKIKKETWTGLGLAIEDLEPVCAEVLEGFKDFEAFHGAA